MRHHQARTAQAPALFSGQGRLTQVMEVLDGMVPGGQGSHTPDPGDVACVSGGHGRQASSRLAARVTAPNVPGGHGRHACRPVALPNVPMGQGVQ